MKNTKFLVKVNRGGARAADTSCGLIERLFRPQPTRNWPGYGKIHCGRRGQSDAEFPLYSGTDIGFLLEQLLFLTI